jgi:hypothetical protein
MIKKDEPQGVTIKERPIIFDAESVRAILAGHATQTRRIIKPQPQETFTENYVAHTRHSYGWTWQYREILWTCPSPEMTAHCPWGVPGERMWLRENCRAEELPDGLDGVRYLADNTFVPIENTAEAADRWGMLHAYDFKRRGYGSIVPAIHMPRWASRITLEITEVRVEHVQDISETDAQHEGWNFQNHDLTQTYDPVTMDTARQWFRDRWNAFYAKRGYDRDLVPEHGPYLWDANPWVWVISFTLIKEINNDQNSS